MDAKGIAAKAAELVGGDRAEQHGDKGDNFGRTATLWNAYMSIRRDPASPIDGVDFANMMVLAKMSRIHSGKVHNIDNYVDMAGYAACGGEVATIRDMEEGLQRSLSEVDASFNKPGE